MRKGQGTAIAGHVGSGLGVVLGIAALLTTWDNAARAFVSHAR